MYTAGNYRSYHHLLYIDPSASGGKKVQVENYAVSYSFTIKDM